MTKLIDYPRDNFLPKKMYLSTIVFGLALVSVACQVYFKWWGLLALSTTLQPVRNITKTTRKLERAQRETNVNLLIDWRRDAQQAAQKNDMRILHDIAQKL